MRNNETGGMMPEDPIRISDLTERDKGRGVLFHHHHGATERGVLSSWNDRWVFCRFSAGGEGGTAMACDPRQLTFETAEMVRAVRKYHKALDQIRKG